jgi:hypothetical protein
MREERKECSARALLPSVRFHRLITSADLLRLCVLIYGHSSFPSPYTQSLLLQALTSHLPSLTILPSLPTEVPSVPSSPLLMWCDYDEMTHEFIHETAGSSKPLLLASSYIYRKALIRKVSPRELTHFSPCVSF